MLRAACCVILTGVSILLAQAAQSEVALLKRQLAVATDAEKVQALEDEVVQLRARMEAAEADAESARKDAAHIKKSAHVLEEKV